MMTSGYEAPYPQASYPHFEPRRASGNIPLVYDRPVPGPARQRSPSPGTLRKHFDGYVPHHADAMQYRTSYRTPPNYRMEYAEGSYYDRPPSPDPYGPPRPLDTALRERDAAWRFPSKPYDAPDRRPLQPSPSRKFEPSQSWKQTHVPHTAPERSPDRHFQRRSRGSLDSSPERAGRIDRDRYRPSPPKREPYPPGRPDLETYRPPYSAEALRRNDPPHSPNQFPAQNHRRDSGSGGTRVYERAEWPNSVPKRPSGPFVTNPAPSAAWHESTSISRTPPSLLEIPPREPPTRNPSRSSIASSHVSDGKSPANGSVPQLPASASAPLPHPAHLPAKPQAAIDALLRKDVGRANVKTEVVAVETAFPKPTNVQNETSQISPKPTDDAAIKSPNEPPPEAIKSAPAALDAQHDQTPPPHTTTNGPNREPSPPAVDEMPLPLEPSANVSPSPAQAQLSTVANPTVETKQPTPISPIEQPQPVRESGALDVNIIHSPSHSPDNSNTHDPILALSTLPRPDEIPALSSAKTKQEALRIVVMTRLVRDTQSREARVEPILLANRAIAPERKEVHPFATPEMLMDTLFDGPIQSARQQNADRVRPMLKKYFELRQGKVDEKIGNLKEDYLKLQSRWIAHCNSLDEQQKALASQEQQAPLRATRRSTAITDAVRSDFEMEQIIASLGNDEATDPNHLSLRNLAKIPDMISAVEGQVYAVFDDNNYLVENPAEYYAPDTGLHDWTDTEKQTFLEKFGAFPKQFGIIADFLPNKTAAQCVAYYYLHKKMFIDFRKIVALYAPNKRKRRGMGRKRGGGLLADIAMHDMAVKAAPGSASAASGRPTRGRRSLAAAAKESVSAAKPPSRRTAVQFEDTPGSTPTPEPEASGRVTRKRKVAAASASAIAEAPAEDPGVSTLVMTSLTISAPPPIGNSVSASTIIEEDEPGTSERPAKRAKRSRKIKSAATVVDEPGSPTSQATPYDVDTTSKKKDKGTGGVHWTDDEKRLFISLLSSYGTDFKRIAASMPGKTTLQVTNYYKLNHADMNLAQIVAKVGKRSRSPDTTWIQVSAPSSKPSSQSASRPPFSPEGHTNTAKATLMSSVAYDPTKNAYPGPLSGATPYVLVPSRKSTWSGPPLPTRIPKISQQHSPSGQRSHLPTGSPQGYPFSRTTHSQSRIGSGSGISATTRSPDRPRISTTHSSPPLSQTASSKDVSASATAAPLPPPSGAAAIVHSPTIPSPKLPAHVTPSTSQSQPLHSHGPVSYPPVHERGEQRTDQGARYPPAHTSPDRHPRPHSGPTPAQRPPDWRPPTGYPHVPTTYGPAPSASARNLSSPPVSTYRDMARGPYPDMTDPHYHWYGRPHHEGSPGSVPPLPPATRGPVLSPSSHPYSAADSRRAGQPERAWPADPARSRGWYP